MVGAVECSNLLLLVCVEHGRWTWRLQLPCSRRCNSVPLLLPPTCL